MRPVEDESGQAQVVVSKRPDPTFRYTLGQIAERLSLRLVESRLPQILLADLIIAVSESANIIGTLLDFFRAFNVIEFKSENDRFDEEEFVKNEVRTGLLFLQEPGATFENLLNVIITARWPTRFFKYMEARGFIFEPDPGRVWQRRCKVGLQEVVIIICNQLPVEEKYLEWLMFAPTDSKTWRDAIVEMIRLQKWELLELVQGMRPKEVAEVTSKIAKLREEYTPRQQARLKRDRAAALKIYIDMLKEQEPEMYEEFKATEVLPNLTLEQRLTGLKPDEREELLKLLMEQAGQAPK